MGSLAQQYLNYGWSGKLRYEKNVATLDLEATYTYGVPGLSGSGSFQDIVDKWEVACDQEKPELWENQNYINLFTYLDAYYGVPISHQVAHVIKQTAQSSAPTYANLCANLHATDVTNNNGDPYDTGGGATITLYAAIFPSPLVLTNGIRYFANDYFRGATNFVHSKYVIRHTTSAPQNYSANVADFNIERNYSISQFLSEAQNPTLWILPLPNYLAYKVLNYPVPIAQPENYSFGALKMRSDAISAARNRIEIKTEYLIDSWPKHTYPTI